MADAGKDASVPGSLSLNKVFKDGNLAVTIAPRESEPDAAHRRRKDMILCVVSLAVAVFVLSVSFYMAFFSAVSADDKKRLLGICGLVIGGFIGYIGGKKG